MTRFFLFTILLSGQVAFGQFTDSISKITFRYDKGHYTFGSSGRYSISEIIEYSKLNNLNLAYQLSNHIQLKKYYDSATNSISVDTIRLKFSKTPISGSKTEKLFRELNISRDNFNADYVKPFLTAPTKNEVLQTANKYDLKWMFENKYSDRENRRNLYKKIKRFLMLDTFLLMKKPNSEYDLVITDVWNGLTITCLSGADTIEYRSQYFELFGQPVKKYVNKKYSDGKKFINLEINNLIKGFVPASSLISQAVDLNQLKEEYISWFIKTKM
jgi:hypothetical protein